MDNLHQQRFEQIENIAKNSKATRLKVGAMVVPKHGEHVYTGYNDVPCGVLDLESKTPCEKDNVTVPELLHAEEAAIVVAGLDNCKNGSIYITHSPCLHCSAMILYSGITTVYYKDVYKTTAGIEFLEKHGVKVIQYKENP